MQTEVLKERARTSPQLNKKGSKNKHGNKGMRRVLWQTLENKTTAVDWIRICNGKDKEKQDSKWQKAGRKRAQVEQEKEARRKRNNNR